MLSDSHLFINVGVNHLRITQENVYSEISITIFDGKYVTIFKIS